MGTPFSFGLQDRPQTKPIVVSKARKVIAPPRPLRATSTQGMATNSISHLDFIFACLSFSGKIRLAALAWHFFSLCNLSSPFAVASGTTLVNREVQGRLH